jgi:hypothetical protein
MSWLTTQRSHVVDDVFESYLRWREASARVQTAYRRWVESTPQQSGVEFATYRGVSSHAAGARWVGSSPTSTGCSSVWARAAWAPSTARTTSG